LVKKVNYQFKYKNTTDGQVELWLANPPETSQQKFLSEYKDMAVNESTDVPGNHISYYHIAPGETVEAFYEISLLGTDKGVASPKTLSEEERAYYLRATPMVCINETVKETAVQVIGEAVCPKEQARLLFVHMLENYTYKHPPRARGVTHFLEDKKGDCGEYSFLYAALCRAVGIPCRTLVGSFVMGKHQAHVWNEIFIEEEGWIPVDVSMAYIMKKQLWRFFLAPIKTLSWKRYFGETENQRVAFSIDTEHTPVFFSGDQTEIIRSHYESFDIAGEPFIWGKDFVRGKIPYFQPMYLHYYAEEPFTISKIDEVLGLWSVNETGKRKLSSHLKNILLYTALSFLLLYYITSWEGFNTLFPFFIFLYCLSFIIRKERPVFFSMAALYFGFIFIVTAVEELSVIL